MKHLLLITIAAVVLVVCWPSNAKDALFHAAFNGNIEAAKEAIAAGANVNAKSADGHTPLHSASRWAQNEIAELLIAAGADVNAKGEVGTTPLDAAIKYKQTEISALLSKHGGKTGEELKAEGK